MKIKFLKNIFLTLLALIMLTNCSKEELNEVEQTSNNSEDIELVELNSSASSEKVVGAFYRKDNFRGKISLIKVPTKPYTWSKARKRVGMRSLAVGPNTIVEFGYYVVGRGFVWNKTVKVVEQFQSFVKPPRYVTGGKNTLYKKFNCCLYGAFTHYRAMTTNAKKEFVGIIRTKNDGNFSRIPIFGSLNLLASKELTVFRRNVWAFDAYGNTTWKHIEFLEYVNGRKIIEERLNRRIVKSYKQNIASKINYIKVSYDHPKWKKIPQWELNKFNAQLASRSSHRNSGDWTVVGPRRVSLPGQRTPRPINYLQLLEESEGGTWYRRNRLGILGHVFENHTDGTAEFYQNRAIARLRAQQYPPEISYFINRAEAARALGRIMEAFSDDIAAYRARRNRNEEFTRTLLLPSDERVGITMIARDANNFPFRYAYTMGSGRRIHLVLAKNNAGDYYVKTLYVEN